MESLESTVVDYNELIQEQKDMESSTTTVEALVTEEA